MSKDKVIRVSVSDGADGFVLRRDGVEGPWPEVYDEPALQLIAKAIDVDEGKVIVQHNAFNEAAILYRQEHRGLSLDATRLLFSQPSVMKRDLDKLIGAIKRLVKNLEKRPPNLARLQKSALSVLIRLRIPNPDLAVDGPGDEALRYVLEDASDTSNDPEEVLREICEIIGSIATATSVSVGGNYERERIMQLADDAGSAKAWLDQIRVQPKHLVNKKEIQAWIDKNSVYRKQREGDIDIQEWLRVMDAIYIKLTGNSLTYSRDPMGEEDRAPDGSFGLDETRSLNFLMAASKPLGVDISPAAWNGRIFKLRN
ncbi:MAG: hypothetical protein HOL85_23070 [Rhodospirillaceae bacterium]|nr:hypothetical protein [Rhodospirillaceae bacterium]